MEREGISWGAKVWGPFWYKCRCSFTSTIFLDDLIFMRFLHLFCQTRSIFQTSCCYMTIICLYWCYKYLRLTSLELSTYFLPPSGPVVYFSEEKHYPVVVFPSTSQKLESLLWLLSPLHLQSRVLPNLYCFAISIFLDSIQFSICILPSSYFWPPLLFTTNFPVAALFFCLYACSFLPHSSRMIHVCLVHLSYCNRILWVA